MRKPLLSLGVTTLALGMLAVPTSASAVPSQQPGIQVIVTIAERRIPAVNRFIPPLVRGDSDFGGHGPDVRATATLVGIGTNRLSVRLFMEAVETQSDWTTARGTSANYLIYTAPAGNCIRSVTEGTFDELRYLDSNWAVDIFPHQVDSFVREYNLLGDTNGGEAGSRTGMAITTVPIHADVQPC